MPSVTKSGITTSIENGIQIIKFNNPKKRNALSLGAYKIITSSLEYGAKSPEVLITVLTGEGDYYSSGFDMTDPELFVNPEASSTYLKNMITVLIDYPKLLVAVVNGPAIGLAVTTLGLCDIVYAANTATFQTPFSKLGLCAEGCASYTFPRIFGKSKASEMLYVGYIMEVKEAFLRGFVAEIFNSSEIYKIWEKIHKFKEVSQNSIKVSKKITLDFDRAKMHEANKIEMENLGHCFQSEDFANNLVKFMTRKSKL